jgi:thioredoxin-like negative regulator of GroEL
MQLTFNTLVVDVSTALKAINSYQAGAYKEAISDLQCILDLEPKNWDARIMLAACYYKTGQFPAAQRAFQFIADKSDDAGARAKALEGMQAAAAKLDCRHSSGMSALPAEFGCYVERINTAPRAPQGPQWLS